MFVDKVKITAKAGNGGDGAISFHREKFVQNGGPDGGDGGRGGNVVLVAAENMHTLMDFRFKTKYTAASGENGSSRRCTGKCGEDLEIRVPVGTVVRSTKTGRICADMHEAGQRTILLHGGRGGWGNQHFATSTRQAPSFAKPGQRCEVFEFELELKSIADVGLVGFPNVGKSTLLSVVTAAKPKIANYHFTTLTPNLGICRQYGQDFIMADIPGLVEGAHEGVGLGHAFLRHVERTRMLLHVVDVSGSEGRDPIEDFETIQRELAEYGNLSERPQLVAANKCDLPQAQENFERLRAHVEEQGFQIFPISAATHEGLDALMSAVARMLPVLEPIEVFEEEAASPENEISMDEPFTIRKEDGVYIVEGPSMQHLIASVNFGNSDSLGWFHRTLRRTGVIDALREAGATEGDTVAIEDMEFDFVE